MVAIEPEAPPLRTDPDGTIRVGGSRVVLDLVVDAYLDGASPEAIAEMYTTLDLADVYGAIGFYLRHRDEVDAYIAERAKRADQFRERIESNQPKVDEIRARLLKRRSGHVG
jgi:uncharacterized protein (DUF433 family)